MGEGMSQYEEKLDELIIETLDLREDDAKEFRQAVMNLVYEDLFKPLWKQHEDYVKATNRSYVIVAVLLTISIALSLIRESRW